MALLYGSRLHKSNDFSNHTVHQLVQCWTATLLERVVSATAMLQVLISSA